MNLKTEKLELLIFVSIMIAVIAIFSFLVFGLPGFKVFAGIIFISLPFYFIFNNFDLDEGEKFIFSMLAGFSLFSALAYLLGLVISFRISMLAVFFALLLAAFLIRKFNHRNNTNNK